MLEELIRQLVRIREERGDMPVFTLDGECERHDISEAVFEVVNGKPVVTLI